jgi:predicted ATPase/DNA-binding XRE family transcriptional regulator
MARRNDELTAPAFGALLKTLRVQAGLSQEQLAERAGVSASAIGALEQGVRRAPYRHTVAMLSDALGCSEHDRADLDRAADRARSRGPRTVYDPSRLPTSQTSFIHRSEVDDIARLLERRRFVTITGAGGIGKTRTALEIARTFAARGIAGCFVDLTAVTDEDGVWDAVAAARNLPPESGASRIASVVTSIAAAPLLLVLDNCEHIVEHAANAALALVADAPSLRLLTTSRERLGLTRELLYRLPSMQTPTALRLLIERAETFDAHAHEARDDVDRLTEICGVLEGIPLAIELAAFHLAALGPAVVLTRLRDGLSLPGPRDLPQRHQTMAAAIAWSFDLLEPAERAVMECVSVFSGGFTLEAAEHLCGAAIPASHVPALLSQLVQKSLVRVEAGPTSMRYSLLETVRTYAIRQLAARGGAEERHRRHLGWLVDVAMDFANADPRRSPQTLHPEIENIRAALRWALASDNAADAIAAGTIVGRLRLVWFSLERNAELRGWAERLLPLLREPADDTVIAHLCVALVNAAQRDPEAVLRYAERAARLLHGTGDHRLAASISSQIAVRLAQLGRGDEAELVLASCTEWIESAAAYGTFDHLVFLQNRAHARRRLERFDDARIDLQSILDIVDDRVDPDGHHRIRAVMTLAAITFESGNPSGAVRIASELIATCRPANDEPALWLAVAHGELATYQLVLDRLDDAEQSLRTSIRLLRTLAAEVDVFFLYYACICARRGDIETAAQMLGFTDAWYARTGFTVGVSDARFRHAVLEAIRTLSPDAADALRARGARLTFAEMAALVAL